jgi:hypothetical protein
MTLAASLISDCIGFLTRHPGLLLVLIGVVGEIACDWKEMEGRLARAKRLSAILLVVGLMMEFWEAAKSDEEIGKLTVQAADSNLAAQQAAKVAGQANERAAKFDADRVMVEKEAEEIRGTNFILQTRLLELEGAMQPRNITSEQHDNFVSFLKDAPKKPVWVACGNPSSETINLVSKIREMLNDAGYSVSSHSAGAISKLLGAGTSGNGVYSAFSLNINNPKKSTILLIFSSFDTPLHIPEHGNALYQAFEKINVNVSGTSGGTNLSSGEVVVFVTSKEGF